jgi:LL-diaminopimelate aminotransferase
MVYHERRDIVIDGLRKVGFHIETPPAAIYVWARLPEGFTNSMEFSKKFQEISKRRV